VFDWQYAQRTRNIAASEIRELLKIIAKPDIISFAGGIPASELFPYAEIRAAYERILTDPLRQAQALQYSISEGYPPLREWVVAQMRQQGVQLDLSNVLITNGSQQALDILGRLFINRQDAVMVEKPTFLGALQAFNVNQPRYLAAPTDENGIMIEACAPLFAQKPRFIYTIANFQNPGGFTLSIDRRHALLDIAHRHNIPIVEDDAYGQLYYDQPPLPSLLALDARNYGTVEAGGTIYLGSASKILAPGLRIGWVVAPKVVIDQMVLFKQGTDLHTSTINQMLVADLVQQPFFHDHLHTIRRVYKQRRDAMLHALAKYFPTAVRWSQPGGGMFIWVEPPPGIDTKPLLAKALQDQQVAFVPGASFFADRSGINTLRLNFSMMPPEQIEIGTQRLGHLLEAVIVDAGREFQPA